MVTSYVLYLVQELKDQVEFLVCVDNIKQLADHCLYQFHAAKHLCNASTCILSSVHTFCCKAFINVVEIT